MNLEKQTCDNVHAPTVAGFGDEWSRLDQSELPADEQKALFNEYFSIFPWAELAEKPVGFDLGCGSGRWAQMVAPQVAHLHCIEPSTALDVARRNLALMTNCSFHQASVAKIPLPDGSMDFGYTLGVLHHIPDTQAGIEACVKKLKVGAPLLLYLYYAFDQRPIWFRALWRVSDVLRQLISRMPYLLRFYTSQCIAAVVYFPLARFSMVAEKLGVNVYHFPLRYYRHRSFYTMRTDALDRFGTQLERRFTKPQIKRMMESAGLERILFSDSQPYWCAVGYRRP